MASAQRCTVKVLLDDPEKFSSLEIILTGRVHSCRQGKITFIDLLDGSTVRTIQCVFTGKHHRGKVSLEEKYHQEKYHRGATVEIIGSLTKTKSSYEVQVRELTLIGDVDPMKYPLSGKGTLSREFLREIPHLRGRIMLFSAISRIKGVAYKQLYDTFERLDLIQFEAVLITGNECESGAFPFSVTTLSSPSGKNSEPEKEMLKDKEKSKDFFGHPTFLTVSSQLHLEALVCSTLQSGFCMTTAFRAEPSQTRLHAAEFPMPEWELLSGDMYKNMDVAKTVIQDIISAVLKKCFDDLKYLQSYISERSDEGGFVGTENLIDRLQRYSDAHFPIVTHADCVKIMLADMKAGKITFTETPTYDGDFSKEHEHYITKIHCDRPVFVTLYPKVIKAFYMPADFGSEEIPRVACFDLLLPDIGEVVGGSQRIHDEMELVGRMKELDMDIEPLQWYVDLRKYGTIPHGGAGLGFSRLMIALTGIFNIRDMLDFPRVYGSRCFA